MPAISLDLPLLYHTPPEWAAQALARPLALLSDHAHLEKKAAVNALELLNRWPDPVAPENWVQTMCAVARDEVEHLALVARLLSRRGGKLHKFHKNPYANALREQVRLGRGTQELLDRLLVSALIEARSCERFALLAEASEDAELRKVYGGLWASENGHYRSFLELGYDIASQRQVDRRWQQMLTAEAKIIQAQPPGPRIHSGVAGDAGNAGRNDLGKDSSLTGHGGVAGDAP